MQMGKKLKLSLVAVVTLMTLTLVSCSKEDWENVQVYKYEASCSNSDLKSQYNTVIKDATDKGYADYDRNDEVIAACDKLYKLHAQEEKYRTMESCTVEVKRKYVSALDGIGSTTVVTYTYPIK